MFTSAKRILVFFVFLTICVYAKSQVEETGWNVAYYGAVPYEVGLKVGGYMNSNVKAKIDDIYRVQFGYHSLPRDHRTLFVGGEKGKTIRGAKGNSSSIIFGANLGLQKEVLGFSVGVDGRISNRVYDNRYFLMLATYYAYRRHLSKTIDIYGQLGYGHKFVTKEANKGVLLLELGITKLIKRKNYSDE